MGAHPVTTEFIRMKFGPGAYVQDNDEVRQRGQVDLRRYNAGKALININNDVFGGSSWVVLDKDVKTGNKR